jgi:hypothetical protein
MRVRTARVRRYIDSVRESISKRNLNFLRGIYWLTSFIDSSRAAMIFSIFFLVAFALNFAALQFGLILVLGFCSLQLAFYRLANAFFRFIRI